MGDIIESYRLVMINLGTQNLLLIINSLSVYSFSTENKKTLAQHQEQAEESPGLEQPLGVQCPCVSEMVTKTVRGATSQTTGSVSMGKDYKNTGTQ